MERGRFFQKRNEGKKKEKFRIKMSEFHLQIKKMCYNIAIS